MFFVVVASWICCSLFLYSVCAVTVFPCSPCVLLLWFGFVLFLVQSYARLLLVAWGGIPTRRVLARVGPVYGVHNTAQDPLCFLLFLFLQLAFEL